MRCFQVRSQQLLVGRRYSDHRVAVPDATACAAIALCLTVAGPTLRLCLLIVRSRAMNVIDGRLPSRRRSEKDIMTAYTIDTENNITAFASLKEIEGGEEGTQTFSNLEELAVLAGQWPGARLVEIWNSLPRVKPVERFTSRQVAVRRIWKTIQHLQPAGGAHRRTAAARKGSGKRKASRKTGPTNRENTKTAQVIALLRQTNGASLKTIMRTTGWQAHSVRGFISGQLGKKMGLRVRSFQRDGERVYLLKG